MNFPEITIPEPAAVGKWLSQELSQKGPHHAVFTKSGWSTCHWPKGGGPFIPGDGDTPEALLADIRRQLAENDPLAKLRKEWEAMGKPDLNRDDQPR
jgi:hypothetical protein